MTKVKIKMAKEKDNIDKIKHLVIVSMILTVVIFIVAFFVTPNFFYDKHPDGDDRFYDVEHTILLLLFPILISIVLDITMLILSVLSDKIKIIKVYLRIVIVAILANVFQIIIVIREIVDNFHLLFYEYGRQSEAYAIIDILFVAIVILSLAIIIQYVTVIRLGVIEKASIEEGKSDRWN